MNYVSFHNLPWNVVEVSAAHKQPLVECFVMLPLLSVQVEEALRMKGSPTDKEGRHHRSYKSAQDKSYHWNVEKIGTRAYAFHVNVEWGPLRILWFDLQSLMNHGNSKVLMGNY